MKQNEKTTLKTAVRLLSGKDGDAREGWKILCQLAEVSPIPPMPPFDPKVIASQAQAKQGYMQD
jgi:hypothetical protein